MIAANLPTCPKCQQTDQVQKVTAVYGLNTKEWYETRSSTNASGNTTTYQERKEAHTLLGLKLKPPAEPAQPAHPGLWYGIGGIVGLFIGSILCSIVFIPFSLLIPLFTGAAFLPDIAGMPSWQVLAIAVGGVTLCGGLVVLAAVVWLGLKIKQRFERDMQNYRTKKAAYDRDERPRWQRAKERWEQLYFCMRDETVFIPAEAKAIRVDDLSEYLYNPYFR